DPAPVEGLTRALDLAATLGGTVTGSVVLADIPPITNPLATMIDASAMAAAAEDASRATGDTLAGQFSSVAHRLGLPVHNDTFACRPELIGETVAEKARTFDVSFMPFDAASGTHRDVAQALLF